MLSFLSLRLHFFRQKPKHKRNLSIMTLPKLKLLHELYAVCRFPPSMATKLPLWAQELHTSSSSSISSITKTSKEVSVLCDQSSIPSSFILENQATTEPNWKCLEVQGPLDFSLIGILYRISKVLADAGISIFAISTFDTDYIFIKNDQCKKGIEALVNSGYEVLQSENQRSEKSKSDGSDDDDEEEEIWIEAQGNGLTTISSSKNTGVMAIDSDIQSEREDDDFVDDCLGDMFADPDPWDDFTFTFKKPSVSDISQEISIELNGMKAENGQTLNSTGMTIWRASNLLCQFLLQYCDKEIRDKTILEMGAGLGLCSLLAYHLKAKNVWCSDGDTDTLDQMRKNVNINLEKEGLSLLESGVNIHCVQLRWGVTKISNFRKKTSEYFDVIMGSDIIYVEEVVEPIFDIVADLLTEKGKFLLAYARRNVSIDLVLDSATRHGFVWYFDTLGQQRSYEEGETKKVEEGVYVFTRKIE